MTGRAKASECGGKQQHADRAAALSHRAALIQGGAFRQRLAVYRCGHCGCWHVGHKPKPKKVRR